MKDLINISKKVFKAITSGIEINRPKLNFMTEAIEKPDAEVGLSNDILNELLIQNFPLVTTIPVGSDNQVEVSVAAAEIHMKPASELELRITNAAIKYDQTVFNIGLKSNVVAVTLQLGIVKDEKGFRLVGYGWFSEFHIKYLPNWVASRIAEVLTSKLLSPLVNINVDDYLALDRQFATEFLTLKLALKPETASVRVNEDGINVRVRFAKLVK
ncbi:MAG: hypothetical protein MJE63_28220 [Proteobacteria bacterium]|nr:hypothetical protein [Pseudomonadota bacterium]